MIGHNELRLDLCRRFVFLHVVDDLDGRGVRGHGSPSLYVELSVWKGSCANGEKSDMDDEETMPEQALGGGRNNQGEIQVSLSGGGRKVE